MEDGAGLDNAIMQNGFFQQLDYGFLVTATSLELDVSLSIKQNKTKKNNSFVLKILHNSHFQRTMRPAKYSLRSCRVQFL